MTDLHRDFIAGNIAMLISTFADSVHAEGPLPEQRQTDVMVATQGLAVRVLHDINRIADALESIAYYDALRAKRDGVV